MQLEGEPVGVLVGGKVVLLQRGGRERTEQDGETGLYGGDAVSDRPRTVSHLQRRDGEEAAAGKDAALHVTQVRLARRRELGQAGAGRQRRGDDLCLEDPLHHAAAHGIALDGVETTIEGDLDLQGFLGLDSSVRPGYEQIRVTIQATGDFDDDQFAELANLTRYSPVRDIVSNPVPVAIDVTRG